MPTASPGIRIRSSTLHCSAIRSAVMIFVVLAIRLRRSASFSNRALPLTASNTQQLRALTAPAFTGKSRTATSKPAAVPAKIRFMASHPGKSFPEWCRFIPRTLIRLFSPLWHQRTLRSCPAYPEPSPQSDPPSYWQAPQPASSGRRRLSQPENKWGSP